MSEKAYIDAQNRAKSWVVNLINGLKAVVLDGDKDFGKLRDFASKTTQQNVVMWHFKSKRQVLQQLYDTKVAMNIIQEYTGYDPKKHGYNKVNDSELSASQYYARARWHTLNGISRDLENDLKVAELYMTGLAGIDGQVIVDNLIDFGESSRRNFSFDESIFDKIGSFDSLWSNGEKHGDTTTAPEEEPAEEASTTAG